MAVKKTALKDIIVTGDMTIDWNLAFKDYSPGDASQRWNPKDWTRACYQSGGAALLANLIRSLVETLPPSHPTDFRIHGMEAFEAPVLPDDTRFHHSYAIWSQFKSTHGQAWRVKEFLGLDPATEQNSDAESQNTARSQDLPTPHLVVLDDADLGFRNRRNHWPAALTRDGEIPWILLKMSQPIAQGPLWDHLIQHCSERLIVVATADDLRLTEVQISQGLSWERTAQDVAWELVHNPLVNGLARCAYTILSFGTEGITLLSRDADLSKDDPAVASRCSLFFDPQSIEGTWKQDHPGGMIGYTTCLTAAIVYQWMRSRQDPDIQQGIQAGFSAMRDLHELGYKETKTGEGKATIQFPFERISQSIKKDGQPLAEVDVEDPVGNLIQTVKATEGSPKQTFWTILHDRHRQDLDRVAEQIVLDGIEKALPDVPYGRFGYLVTVDRQEIESFRAVCTLVEEYLGQERPKRPLSIGVFGAPGSGKSFGISQVANSLAPGKIEKLEFNLSQMNDSEELPDALHQVRDVILHGKIPLVFWDEFDTALGDKPLGWLRYFLAPMQDGAFREGQLTHPIGRAIFVFAGGTSHTMAGFGDGLSEEAARAAKVPDFVSRLKGFVNVLGPDPQVGEVDPYYIIRRAILLRSILQRNNPALFENKTLRIDSGLLRAFLLVRKYKHGIRSMETIITMSQLSGKPSYARSSLPPESQLNLHVDGQEFLALVQQVQLEGDLLEKLAQAHHHFFCEWMKSKDYTYGPITDDEQKKHSSLLPWDDLPEHEKEQNKSAVRDIPNKLNRVGYVMIPARSDEPAEFPRGKDDLELLSKMEHERWMQAKLSAGWQYAPDTNKEERLHKALLSWEDERLDENEKDKDREFVRLIPESLTLIGYTVVDLSPEDRPA